MKVKDLIEELQRLPQESSVELSRLFAVDTENVDTYELRMDMPIIGIAHNLDDPKADVLLVVEYVDDEKYRNIFGEFTKFENYGDKLQ